MRVTNYFDDSGIERGRKGDGNLFLDPTFPRFRNSGNVLHRRRGRGEHRQSRLCRLLGNPVAFAVVQLLAEVFLTHASRLMPSWVDRSCKCKRVGEKNKSILRHDPETNRWLS